LIIHGQETSNRANYSLVHCKTANSFSTPKKAIFTKTATETSEESKLYDGSAPSSPPPPPPANQPDTTQKKALEGDQREGMRVRRDYCCTVFRLNLIAALFIIILAIAQLVTLSLIFLFLQKITTRLYERFNSFLPLLLKFLKK